VACAGFTRLFYYTDGAVRPRVLGDGHDAALLVFGDGHDAALRVLVVEKPHEKVPKFHRRQTR
jgi:hypothetical protein